MSEKRFGYGAGVNWQEDVIIDYETEKSYDFYEVGKLLNELHEENKELKNICKNLINEVNKRGITVTMTDKHRRGLENDWKKIK